VRTSTVVVGLIFGAILAAVLLAPLFVALPARYVTDWFYVNPSAALIGLLAALASLVCAGFLGATLDRDEAIRAGTSSGLLASVVAGIAVALPAAEIEACGSLLSIARYDTMTAEMLREVTGETAIDGVWIPAMSGLALLLIGPALGAVGGVIFDLWQGTPGRSNRTIRRSIVPLVGLGAVVLGVLLAAMWAIHLDITVLPRLGREPGWRDRTALSSPLIVAGAATCLLLAWAMRDAVLTWRGEARLFGLGWAMTALAAPVTMGVIIGGMHPRSLVTPDPWLALVAVAVAAVGSVILASGSDVPLEREPRRFDEIFGEALLAGILVVGSIMFVSGASIVGTLTIAFPYVRALLGGAALVEAPPADLVTRVFATHWWATGGIFVVAMIYLGILGPLWAFGRVVTRR
jgi:hypothetical protein